MFESLPALIAQPYPISFDFLEYHMSLTQRSVDISAHDPEPILSLPETSNESFRQANCHIDFPALQCENHMASARWIWKESDIDLIVGRIPKAEVFGKGERRREVLCQVVSEKG